MRRVSNPYSHHPFSDNTFFFSLCLYPLFCVFSLTNVRHSKRWIFESLFTPITLQLQLLKQSITMVTTRASYQTMLNNAAAFYDMIIKRFVKQDSFNLVNIYVNMGRQIHKLEQTTKHRYLHHPSAKQPTRFMKLENRY